MVQNCCLAKLLKASSEMIVVWPFLCPLGTIEVPHVTKRNHMDTENRHQPAPLWHHLLSPGTTWTHIIVTNRHHIGTNRHHLDTQVVKKGNHFKELQTCVSKSGQ